MNKYLMKNKGAKILPILVIILVLLFVGYDFGYKRFKMYEKNESLKITVLDVPAKEEVKVAWMIGQKSIVFRKMVENIHSDVPFGMIANNEQVIHIVESDGFPKLFENMDYNALEVTPFISGGKTLYLIANKYYQAAGYTLEYAIVIDIFSSSNKALFETEGSGTYPTIAISDNGDIKVSSYNPRYDYGNINGYYISEFYKFDGKTKFVSSNKDHKDDFIQMKADLEKNNSCSAVPGGEDLTFEEIRKEYGEDHKCRPSESDYSMSWFLGVTPKEYFDLKDRIEEVLK